MILLHVEMKFQYNRNLELSMNDLILESVSLLDDIQLCSGCLVLFS